jgi:hypothetical protein
MIKVWIKELKSPKLGLGLAWAIYKEILEQ